MKDSWIPGSEGERPRMEGFLTPPAARMTPEGIIVCKALFSPWLTIMAPLVP